MDILEQVTLETGTNLKGTNMQALSQKQSLMTTERKRLGSN